MSERILFADNDHRFLKTQKRALEKAGYTVIPAGTVSEAQTLLERGEMDIAILDIRLRDDGDERDISGLSVARRCNPSIPKIILTNHPTIESVREALGPSDNGKPIAEDLIDKDEKTPIFLERLRRIIDRQKAEKQSRTRQQLELVVGQLKTLIGNPVLHNYRGFVCMMITAPGDDAARSKSEEGIRMSEGEEGCVTVWLQPEQQENFPAELLNITDGEEAAEVGFEVIVDSDTLKFSVDRKQLNVRPNLASEHLVFPFFTPSTPGKHDVWAKVFQKNMLIQIVKGTVQVDAKGD